MTAIPEPSNPQLEARLGFLVPTLVLIALVAVVLAVAAVAVGVQSPPSSTLESVTSDPKPSDIEGAYLGFWEAYGQALRNLDGNGLELVATGDALDELSSQVERQAASNIPIAVEIDHDYTITLLGSEIALVRDSYVSRSVPLDPESGERAGDSADRSIANAYVLRLEGERWKVALILRSFR